MRGMRLMVPAPAALAAPAPPPPPPPPVIEGALGDYHLYTLAEPTTLAARQTKQVMFLHAAAVPFDESLVAPDESVTAGPQPARVVLRFDDTKTRGLGRGLPAGHVQVRRRPTPGDGPELLVGRAALDRDVPVGEPFELTVGADADVRVKRTVTAHTVGRPERGGLRRVDNGFDVEVTNARSEPVTVEIRHPRLFPRDFRVTAESEPHALKSGDPIWRLVVPAGGARDLTYSVSFLR
jgi:hypothetical protein